MDLDTITAYDTGAQDYADDWESQPPSLELHDLVRQHFGPGRTADIGCGSGRDTAWLASEGYPVVGYDASEGLLAEARRRHPSLVFEHATLPALQGISTFTNVMCETVIMHLPAPLLGPSVARLRELVEPDGTLYLSWRVAAAERRDDRGRLYAAVSEDVVRAALSGGLLLHDEASTSSSSGAVLHRLLVRF